MEVEGLTKKGGAIEFGDMSLFRKKKGLRDPRESFPPHIHPLGLPESGRRERTEKGRKKPKQGPGYTT